MDTAGYRYAERGRRPLTLVALAFAAVLLGLGVRYDAPVVWLVVVGVPAFALLGLVVRNTETWIVVAPDSLTWHDGWRETRLARDRIARVEVREWSDSTDVIVHLADGSSETIPDRCRPGARRLAAELSARGYPVDDIGG